MGGCNCRAKLPPAETHDGSTIGGFKITSQKLGEGSFSAVLMATKDERRYACKVVDKKKMPQEHLENEIKALQLVANHSNVVQLFFEQDGMVPGKNNNKHYLIMELMAGADMFDLIQEWQENPKSRGNRKQAERDTSYVCGQVAAALCYCHAKGVVHRDLKPENLMLQQKSSLQGIKIVDFGFATIIPEGETISPPAIVGSPGYLAPELRLGQPYGSAVDMWSLGILIYVLLFGFMPFPSEPIKGTRLKPGTDVKKKFKFDQTEPAWKLASAGARNLILGLLEVDPAKRLTALQVMETPWVQEEAKKHGANVFKIDTGARARPVTASAVSDALENIV